MSLRLATQIIGIFILLTSSTLIEARRRSRIELPIENAADAPLEDNLATASDVEIVERIKAPFVVEDKVLKIQDEIEVAPFECETDNISFELITGYVLSSSENMIETVPTLKLTECLLECQNNKSCYSINYETGLCVLFSSNSNKLPGALAKSQFPVFTIFAQKVCLKKNVDCNRSWSIDRVQGYALRQEFVRKTSNATSRQECYERCFEETEFICRSANFYESSGACELSDMDRITLGTLTSLKPTEGSDYLENNCANEPTKLCEFKRLPGRILKTVDSVHQDIETIDECRELCLNAPFKCHSYDFGDTGDNICRLSHHSRVTLNDIQDAYLEVPEATTFELSSCYNVTIECRSGDMVAKIKTSKIFDGKVYAKGSPNSCSVDVKNALEFELRMGYQDLECNVRQTGLGRYLNDVVIQHHDMIVTSSDLGLALSCQYDLANKTVSNDADLGIEGDIETALNEEVHVESPNVIMKITTRDGSSMEESAEVGDPLALKFEIMDENSPFEIFVRELVAMDGANSGEITLIDSNGCPTDHFIMGPIYKGNGKHLISHFDAFKFPSSPTVQFRALITPCMPTCEPVQCDGENYGSESSRSIFSYGRKKRSANDTITYNHENSHLKTIENMLLVQSIEINDKFGFEQKLQQDEEQPTQSSSETFFYADQSSGFCVNGIGLLLGGTTFLLVQLIMIVMWTLNGQSRSKQNKLENPTSLGIQMHKHSDSRSALFNRDILSMQ